MVTTKFHAVGLLKNGIIALEGIVHVPLCLCHYINIALQKYLITLLLTASFLVFPSLSRDL